MAARKVSVLNRNLLAYLSLIKCLQLMELIFLQNW